MNCIMLSNIMALWIWLQMQSLLISDDNCCYEAFLQWSVK